MNDQPLVVVTGASGFIATHCILQLLEHGYRVRGTVRAPQQEERLRAIFSEQVQGGEQLQFVAADLLQDEGWSAAMRGCTYVLHVASPIRGGEARTEEEFIVPALAGTKRVLEAAAAANVKRVVLTSSTGAIRHDPERPRDRPLTEDDWAEPSHDLIPYARSKLLAERAAWEFIATHPALELATIAPAYVIGPVFDARFSPSVEIVLKVLRKDLPGMPRLGFSLVDVRDVAAAHLSAMVHPDAAGKRFCCATGFLWLQEIADILNHHFAARGYRVPTRRLPDALVRLFARFDRSLAEVVAGLGEKIEYSNTRLTTVLGWQPHSLETSVVDTAESLIAKGVVRIPSLSVPAPA